MSARDVIEDVIASSFGLGATVSHHAENIETALSRKGYEVIELPEAEPAEDSDIATGWDTPREVVNIWHSHPTEIKLYEMTNKPLSSSEARDLAAALLAAARHADREDQ